MKVFNSIFSWVIKKRIHDIEFFKKYPHDVQNECLNKLIETAKDTEWGKRYDYQSILTLDEYKSRIPIQDYESLKKDILRIKKGEQNILWPTEIKWFAKSSGTTSDKSKYIPVSKESLFECHYKGGKDLLSMYCNNIKNHTLFSGRTLAIGGSSQILSYSNDTYAGDLSAILTKNLPFWVQLRKTPKYSISLLDDWEEKLEQMAQTTAKQDISIILGVPSWTLMLLNRVLEIKNETDISAVWPNLELYMHGGVNFSPYKPQFEKLISRPDMNYVESYNASEGFFGIQDEIDGNGMLLMLDYGIYYEFMTLEEVGKKNPKTITLSEVKLDTEYDIIVSTNAGLWRYDLGDTVKFTSINPYRIKITGRTKHFINAFGEELMVHNVEDAIEIATTKTNSIIREYTVAPKFDLNSTVGSHDWLIEFEQEPKSMDYFIEVLDNALKSLNSDYEAKRFKNIALTKPEIISAPNKTFYNWMKHHDKLGGQYKVPRLFNDRKHIDSILEFMNLKTGIKIVS
ncbi:MAG: GH3 auxin-responsive promoter family protein [Flavobacteriales bacterium]|nr:GH3 auxin-responsive promoter family protein [Flavobacteriales bacterium]